jgi:hypothetical protein
MGIAETILSLVCKPVLIFTVFLSALICFDVTQKDFKAAAKNAVYLIAGDAMLMLLCLGGFEPAAWILLGLIPFFFAALIALLLITQIVRTEAVYDDGTSKIITGSQIRSFFGVPDKKPPVSNGQREDPNHAFDGANQLLAPSAEETAACDAEPKPTPLPIAPQISTSERISKQMGGATDLPGQPIMCPTCNSCDTCS